MSLQRTLAELLRDCQKRGIEVDPTVKYGRRELVAKLAAQSIQMRGGMEKQSWGFQMRMKMESPMLCFAYKHLKPQEQENLNKSSRWIVEKKYDGCRLIACYHPNEGFTFWGRNISVDDYLPVEYTGTLLLIKDGGVRNPGEFKGVWAQAFMIDTEVLCDNKNLDTTLFSQKGVVTGTELNAVSAILAMNEVDSHQMQMTQAPLRLEAFDIMYFDKSGLTKSKLELRKKVLNPLIIQIGKHAPITESAWTSEGKEDFYKKITEAGGEGIIYKNLDMPYLITESRPRTTQVKRKRSVAESMGGDIDAFVCGFVASDESKSWGELVGALKMAVFLKNGDSEKEHWIASISSMPLAMRQQMTEKGPDGKAQLKKEYYGRVLTINGQDISSRKETLRFMHSTADWNRGFRVDKTKFECVMEEEFLHSQVL